MLVAIKTPGDVQTENRTELISIDLLDASPFQVRLRQDSDHLAALAASIEDMNFSSHIVVRPKGTGRYEIVCGENRVAACKALGRGQIPAIVRQLSDCEAACIAAADNMQRKNLSDYEVSRAVNILLTNRFATTEASVARIIGRPRSYVAKIKAYQALPEAAIEIVQRDPDLFGANLVADLKASGYCRSHPNLVVEAFRRVISGALTQAGVISYLRNKTSTSSTPTLRDTKFRVRDRTVRMTIYQDTIRITCKGMDSLALEERLQEALMQLL